MLAIFFILYSTFVICSVELPQAVPPKTLLMDFHEGTLSIIRKTSNETFNYTANITLFLLADPLALLPEMESMDDFSFIIFWYSYGMEQLMPIRAIRRRFVHESTDGKFEVRICLKK